jgi:hypothetical protein
VLAQIAFKALTQAIGLSAKLGRVVALQVHPLVGEPHDVGVGNVISAHACSPICFSRQEGDNDFVRL